MKCLAIAFTAAAFSVDAFAQTTALPSHPRSTPADSIKWSPGPPTLKKGAEVALLYGDPTKPGPFIFRLRFPAGYDIPPHTHPQDEALTVISGKLNLGYGEKMERKGDVLPPASFGYMPANMPHYVWVEEETVLQVNSQGPFDITYVDPKHDPQKR